MADEGNAAPVAEKDFLDYAAEETSQDSTTEGASSPPWFFADGVPGTGPKPEYYKAEKYKTLADQAKAQVELEQKLGVFTGAPEQYSFENLSEAINKESGLLKALAPKFKELNMSQTGFENLVNSFVEIQQQSLEIHPEDIIKDLGPNGAETFGRVAAWAKNNFTPEEQNIFREIATSADAIKLLDKIRAGAPKSRAPTHHDIPYANNFETANQVMAEKRANWQKYKDNPEYAAEISRRYQDALMREGVDN